MIERKEIGPILLRNGKKAFRSIHSWSPNQITGVFWDTPREGTTARLSLTLLFYAGQRRGDLIWMAASTYATILYMFASKDWHWACARWRQFHPNKVPRTRRRQLRSLNTYLTTFVLLIV